MVEGKARKVHISRGIMAESEYAEHEDAGMDLPKVSIIVLNFNGWEDTLECLESLTRISYPNYEILAIDNGSRNDSVNKIIRYCRGEIKIESNYFASDNGNKPIHLLEISREAAEKNDIDRNEAEIFSRIPGNRKLKLILNEKNYGFAEGCNIGIRHCMGSSNPEYVLLLNNDTVVASDFLNGLVEVCEKDQSIAFSGSKILYYEAGIIGDKINSAGRETIFWKGISRHIGADEIDRGQYTDIHEVDCLSGTCILARTKILKEIGLFDSTFFAYYEDDDLCVRGMRAGYRSVFVPMSRVWHKISKTGIGNLRIYYMTRNRFWFLRKNATSSQYFAFMIFFFSFQFWLRAGSLLLGQKDFDAIRVFLRGTFHGLSQNGMK